MAKRINIFWKVIFIILLIALSLLPLYFMQQYLLSMLEQQNTALNLVSQSTNYIADLIESAQNGSSAQVLLNLKENYLLAVNSIKSAPLTLGLACLVLLLIDIVKLAKLSFINYFIVMIGLVLFYFIELVLVSYLSFSWAYFIPVIICCLLLGVYLSGSLSSIACGTVYAIGLFIIYTLAFYLMSKIDNILLYGAISLVVIFIAVILMTRSIDWHHPTERVKGGAKKLN